MMFFKPGKTILSVFVLLAGLNVLAWLAVWDLHRGGELEVTFFDVGQGDSIFIETPAGRQILIDGGPDERVLEKLAEEMPFWDRTIDFMILTHPEHDHYGGLLRVLEAYEVQNVLWSGITRDTAEYREWQRLLGEEGAEIFFARAGQRIRIGELTLSVLHPFSGLEGKEFENSNNTSVIVRLVFGETSFLFTGDAYKSVEEELVETGVELDSDVLKVGHHGSKTSSSGKFIEAVSPEIAVIQCGKDNSYGHPDPGTLESLGEAKVFRTDLDGDVKIVSDGTKITGISSR